MISVICAIAEGGVIGKDNSLPWHYPEDLRYFKATTLGKTVLMGEATFRSIIARLGHPLPGRKTVVASLSPDFTYPGVEIVRDCEQYLLAHRDTEEEIFVAGGASIYRLALPVARRLYITHINARFAGDTYFPPVDYARYRRETVRKLPDLEFCIYERIGR